MLDNLKLKSMSELHIFFNIFSEAKCRLTFQMSSEIKHFLIMLKFQT